MEPTVIVWAAYAATFMTREVLRDLTINGEPALVALDRTVEDFDLLGLDAQEAIASFYGQAVLGHALNSSRDVKGILGLMARLGLMRAGHTAPALEGVSLYDSCCPAQEVLKASGLKPVAPSALSQAASPDRVASATRSGKRVATTASGFQEAQANGNPKNMVTLAPFWANPFVAFMDYDTCVAALKELARIINRACATGYKAVAPFTVLETASGVVLDFEGPTRRLVVTPDGVFDARRSRRMQSVLLVGMTGQSEREQLTSQDVAFLNPYAVLLRQLCLAAAASLLNPQEKAYRKVGQWYDKVVMPALAFENLKEIAAEDGDRQHYDRYQARMEGTLGDFPYEAKSGKLTPISSSKLQRANRCKARKWQVAPVALREFNLVQTPRGNFADGRRCVVRIKDVPEHARAEYLRSVLMDATGAATYPEALAAVRKQFPHISILSDADLVNHLSVEMVYTLSTKTAKVVKRTIMDAPLNARLTIGGSRGLVAYHQVKQSDNCAAVVSALLPQHVAAPGTSWRLRKDALGLAIVPHRIKGTVPLGNSVPIVTSPVFSAEPVMSNGWTLLVPAEPVQVIYGEAIVRIQCGEAEYFIPCNKDEAFITQVAYATEVVGDSVNLTVEVSLETYEDSIKGRNYIKTMVVDAPASVFDLNSGKAADLLLFSDTIKSLDLSVQWLDAVALTAFKNAHHPAMAALVSEIQRLNELTGKNPENALVFHPALAAVGAYKELLSMFEQHFGAAVWVRHDCAPNSFQRVLWEMYCPGGTPVKGWQKVEGAALAAIQSLTAPDAVAIAQGDPESDKTNVLVFAGNVVWQRGYGYVGTPECPLYQPIKAELSSVRTNIGTTSIIASVFQAVAGYDQTLAGEMVSDGEQNVMFCGRMMALTHKRSFVVDGVELPSIPLMVAGKVNPAIVEAIPAEAFEPENLTLRLKLLTEALGNVVVDCGSFRIHLPTVAHFDSATNLLSTQSIGWLVADLFVAAAKGSDLASYIRRLGGAIENFAKSAGVNKSPNRGRKATTAKVVGLPFIPMDEVWVRISGRQDSVYQTLRRVNPHQSLNGMRVIGSRPPLPFVVGFKLVIIGDEHQHADLISPDMFYLNTLGMYSNRGDQDGDPYVVVRGRPGMTVPMNSFEFLCEDFIASTGSAQLVPGGAYWGDHFNILSYDKVQAKRQSGLKNISLLSGGESNTMDSLLYSSSQMQWDAINVGHRIALTADFINSLMTSLVQAGGQCESLNWATHPSIKACLYENYEVALGGLDWAAYDYYFKGLVPIYRGANAKEAKVELMNLLDKAGMNTSVAGEVAEAAFYARIVATGKCLPQGGHEPSLLQAILIVAALAVEISKGRNPNGHELYNAYKAAKKQLEVIPSDNVVMRQVANWETHFVVGQPVPATPDERIFSEEDSEDEN